METSKKKKVNFRQEFISRILVNNINWPRENKVMGQLILSYPEEGFWRSVVLTFKIPSLAWFLTEKGKEYLRKEYLKFKFVPSEGKTYEFDNEIVLTNTEEKPIIGRKIKTLKEFLKSR